MIDKLIIEKAIEEITIRNYGFTKQFLEVHEIAYESGLPKVEGIHVKVEEGVAEVYFSVLEEKFFFCVGLCLAPEIKVEWVSDRPFVDIYFRITSSDLYSDELVGMTILKPIRVWNRGDFKKKGRIRYKYSGADFSTGSSTDSFEDRLSVLLDFLEQDKDGIRKLAAEVGGYIQVHLIMYNGNTMLGGPTITKNHIHRMSGLGLEINFDIYAEGNLLKDSVI